MTHQPPPLPWKKERFPKTPLLWLVCCASTTIILFWYPLVAIMPYVKYDDRLVGVALNHFFMFFILTAWTLATVCLIMIWRHPSPLEQLEKKIAVLLAAITYSPPMAIFARPLLDGIMRS